MVDEDAAPPAREAARPGHALARGTGNGERAVALAVEPQARLRASVLDEDRAVAGLGHAAQVVEVLRVHDRGVAVAALHFDREIDRARGVRHAADRHHRHHLLGPEQRVVFVHFDDDEAHRVGRADAHLAEDHVRVLADEVFVEARLLPRPFHLGEDDALELGDAVCRQHDRVVPGHRGDERVGDGSDDERLFLVGADDGVVGRGAEDDVARGLVEVGGLVDDDGRIAGAGADRALAAEHRLADDVGAAGDDDEAHAAVFHQLLRRLDGRIGDAGDDVRRAARADDRFVQQRDRLHAAVLRVRVDVEDDAVPRGEHADGVADDGGGRIRDRRDRADDAERRRLDEGQAVVAARGDRREVFEAGRLLGDEAVLDDLVLVAPVAGLVVRGFGEHRAVLEHRRAHGFEDLGARGERQGHELLLGDARRLHGLGDGAEDSMEDRHSCLSLVVAARGDRRECLSSIENISRDPARDLVDLAIGEAVHRRAHFLYFSQSPMHQLSTMGRITQATRRLSGTGVLRAELPAAISTTSSGPAPTASAETMAFPVSFPSSSSGLTTRSLMPLMLCSLRVETTVPTTLASCMAGSYPFFPPPPAGAGVRPSGMTASTWSCGRAMTWTVTTSPTRPAAVWAASMAARTAATSPRTTMVV